jgi:hypothetical protein
VLVALKYIVLGTNFLRKTNKLASVEKGPKSQSFTRQVGMAWALQPKIERIHGAKLC